jgi:hypothetical protein
MANRWRKRRLNATPGRLDQHFRYVWAVGADLGVNDELDGAECRRLYSAWVAAGRPLPVGDFLRAFKAREAEWLRWGLGRG